MVDARYDFGGRSVLITGATGGIGLSTALKFYKSGANVLLCDVEEKTLASAEAELRTNCEEAAAKGACVASLVTDVNVPDQVERMVQVAVEKFGKLDVAVNIAGIEGERAPISEASIENWDKVMGVNAKGIFMCMKYELAQMHRQMKESETSEGETAAKRRKLASDLAIVNMASTAGQGAMADFSAYAASKAAVISLTRTAAKEVASKGVRVNAVCPSTTRTPMVARFTERWPAWQAKQNASFPIGRIGEPEEVADVVLFLCSASSSFVTGTCVTIDGALSA
mmetsp:Transcript_149312/g.263588  ORF Transcript_149312/g.263588 Transcript_149312/m.263588 type:complete len:282 (+) Transcript_149312:77-922(+)